jgi:sugar/nucleoside kinase (ribokinase family)
MAVTLVTIGLATLDVLGRPIDVIPERGGTTLIDRIAVIPAGTAGGTALVAAALGVSTRLASAVGNDGAGRFVRSELEAKGVDTSFLAVSEKRPTSTTMLTIRKTGERPNFHAIGASSFYEITEPLMAAVRETKFVHWAGVGGARLDGGPGAALLAAAKDAGAIVTCDLIGPGPKAMDELARLLPHVDYFMPNMEEALHLSKAAMPEDAAKRFREMGAKTCIFKWGERGSFIAKDGGNITLPAHAIEVVDTTSCGDSYCAGFIAARDRGFELIEACRFATATAALVAQGLGTLGALVDFESTLSYMREAPLRSVS